MSPTWGNKWCNLWKRPGSFFEGMQPGRPRSTNLLRRAHFSAPTITSLCWSRARLPRTVPEFTNCKSLNFSFVIIHILPTKYFGTQLHIPLRNSFMKLCFLPRQQLWVNISGSAFAPILWRSRSLSLSDWTQSGSDELKQQRLFHERPRPLFYCGFDGTNKKLRAPFHPRLPHKLTLL